MSSTTPIATPAQSPCKGRRRHPRTRDGPPCIDAATPTAAATKSEPRAPTPLVRAAALGADHPSTATTLSKKAHALERMGGSANLAAAAALYDLVIEIMGADHPDAATLHEKANALVQMNGSANRAAAIALYDLATAALKAAATLHEAVSHPTPLTAVPAPAAEFATMDEPTATTTATDGAPATPDHAVASARRSTTSRTATTKSAGRSTPAVLLGTPARRTPLAGHCAVESALHRLEENEAYTTEALSFLQAESLADCFATVFNWLCFWLVFTVLCVWFDSI
jgi:hypothetical protein